MESKTATVEQLSKFFCQPLHIAAALNKMSIADFKKFYNSHGIKRWPHNKHKNKSSTSVNMKGFQDFQIISIPKYLMNTPQPDVEAPKSKPTPEDEKQTPDSEFEAFCKNLDYECSVRDAFEDYFSDDLTLSKE
jgi:hypothetical protein